MVSVSLFFAGLVGFASAAFKEPNGSNDTTPMQLRLAYAGPTGMVVSWNTFAQLVGPTVYYGNSPGQLNQRATSNVSVTYPTSTTYNNHVKITGLEPDTTYYYLPQTSNSTTPLSFKTTRPVGDTTPYTIAVVVDLGTMGSDGLTTHVGTGAANPLKPNETNTIQSLENNISEYDFLWHAGDLAYADYWLKEEIQGFLPNTTLAGGAAVYERILNEFYDQLEPVTSLKPYLVGPGNHEANCDNGGTTNKLTNTSYTVSICMPGQTNFTGYINHFRMPSAESGGTGNFWYSWDHGMVHYVQLDTETDLGHGFISPDEPGGSENEDSGPFNPIMNAQTTWLSADLAAVNRTLTPWVIVAGHRPWYISYQNKSSAICTECKDVFEPIFLNYSVDLVLSGHVHAYQRNQPMFDYKVDPAGLNNPKYPWYITNGAAGHYDGLDVLQKPIPATVPYAQDTAYGWSKLTFHNCSALTHEFVASGNGSVLDSATLYKNRTCLSSPAKTSAATTVPANTAGVPWLHRPTGTAWPGQGWAGQGGQGHPHGPPSGGWGQQGHGRGGSDW